MMMRVADSPLLSNAENVGLNMQPIAATQIVITESTMIKMNKIIIIAITLLSLVPTISRAQFGFDVASVEAYIHDHKEQRSLLLVRSTLEASNKLLHDYSSEANIGYKDINTLLDRYTRAFDIIDILYQTLRTSLNIYNTYETCS